jgi:hypothetical protein
MKKDNGSLGDYSLAHKDEARTVAEERRMLDDAEYHDMSTLDTTHDTESKTHSSAHLMNEQTLITKPTMAETTYRQRHRAITQTSPMQARSRSLTKILRLIPEEDVTQVSAFQGLVYMPERFLEKYLLPTMQMRKTLDEQDDSISEDFDDLSGGQETAMMYSIFRLIKDTYSVGKGSKMRSLIAHLN